MLVEVVVVVALAVVVVICGRLVVVVVVVVVVVLGFSRGCNCLGGLGWVKLLRRHVRPQRCALPPNNYYQW